MITARDAKSIHRRHAATDDELLGCFGGFTGTDRLCQHYCALRLRCAIEKSQALRLELLEDLVIDQEQALTLH